MVLFTTSFWKGERNCSFAAKLQQFILLYEKKKNQWKKKTATGATRKKLKMVVGLGVFAGLEKASIFLRM